MNNDLIKVLIIEDNDLFRKSLANVINKSSKMKCAGSYISAEDALKDIEQKELKPQVVLMDIGLPGITGVECISYIKDLSRETKIIMLTIHDDDDNIFKAVCSGAAGYLLKDMHPGKIIESIEEVPVDSTVNSLSTRKHTEYEYNIDGTMKHVQYGVYNSFIPDSSSVVQKVDYTYDT
ncbi:MAG: response regulator transcription factor, partial [Bacteroidetes bacterium]|nr:response regulator transcription factor [Bacteroidota bacterium]